MERRQSQAWCLDTVGPDGDSEGHLSFWLEHQVVPLNRRHTGEAASARGTDEQLSFRQVKVPEETR